MRTLLCLLGLLVVACGPAPAATPTPVAPLTFEGISSGDTARFTLPAGDYTVLWQANPLSDPACSLIGLLIPNDDAIHGYEFGHTNQGRTRINGVLSATYYVHVASGSCGWTVGVQPAH
jgi:hypothetical protein